jgi:hypothetical protein
LEHVRRTAHAAGLRAATFGRDGAAAALLARRGFDFVVPGSDFSFLRSGALAALNAMEGSGGAARRR